MRYLSAFNILLIIFTLTSCVGTVQEFGEQTQRSVIDNPYDIRFDGIIEAKATAHNKVRVYFKPAQGGSGTFSYNAYVDGNYSSAAASTTGGEVDENGNFYIDVKGLQTGRTHSFLVRAYDIQNAAEDKNNIIINVATLPFEVPIFDGIYTLENIAGIQGETALKATWIKANAASEGSGFGVNPRAISGYNIYVGTTTENMILFGTVSDPDVTEYIISGLAQKTKYYVRVLARDSQSPINLEDANMEIKSLATKSSAPISFLGLKTATIPNDSSGFSKINLTWDSGTGGFDRYRIFVRTDANTPDPENDTPHTTDVTNLTTESIQISVTNPYTLYYVTMVACNSSTCDEYEGEKVNLPVTTTPPVAPFNGIVSLTQATGQFGLTQLEATWFEPDSTQGVYDEIKLYQMDNVGNVLNEIVACTSGSDPCYEIVSPTKRKIINLTQGDEYCFMAKAYSTTPYKADEPNGRTHTNEVSRCATPAYQEPAFSGPLNTCSNITSSGLTVDWEIPNPAGTFERFEIYHTSISTPFDFTQAVAGNTDYTLVTVDPSQASWALTGLNPATTYQIGVKTYLDDIDNPGTGFRDSNIKVITCQTLPATATHNGWFNLMSLGAKVDGRDGSIIPERYRDVDLTATPPIYIPYPQEFPAGDPAATWPDTTAVSSSGMVVLEWDDFMIEGVGKMYDILDRHPDNGYNVYRKDYDPTHETFAPPINDVSNTALASWTKLNTSVIKPVRQQVKSNIDPLVKYDRDIGKFVDYSVINNDEEKTKVYWYLVVATVAGKNVAWSTTPSDGKIEVVVPPRNMALMHRWMANLSMCDILRRDVDRENHYRCEYNGLGSTYDSVSNKHYYDMGKHVITNRFGLGTKFSKGKCRDVGYSSYFRFAHYNSSNIGVFDGVSTPGGTGDCIGSRGNPDGQVEAETGDIFYDRIENRVYINWTGGDINNKQLGTTWHYFQDWNANQRKSTSIIYQNDLQKIISTNNSHMPSMVTRYSNQQALCSGYKVTHKSSDYFKRLIRRKEQIPFFQHTLLLDDNEIYSLERAQLQTPSVLQTSCNKVYRRGYLTNTDLTAQDYSSSGNDHYTYIGGRSTGGSDIFGIANHADTQFLAIGSSGSNSTEMCVSKFGIQDHTGFDRTTLSDTFWANTTLSGYDVKYERDETDPTIKTVRTDYGVDYDPSFIEDWKNGNGLYYNSITGGGESFAEGVSTTWVNQYSQSGNLFFNPIMGIYLSCSGTTCMQNSSPDDNQLFSHLSSGTPAIYKGFRFAKNTPRAIQRFDQPTSAISPLSIEHGWWNGAEYNSIYGLRIEREWTSSRKIRCATQIPSNGD